MKKEKTAIPAADERRPDCVTKVRMGNSVLIVSGFFKKGATATAVDKMAKVLETEARQQQDEPHTA